MSLFRRQAHIEYTGYNSIIITTSFKQKKFFLRQECTIDLINLEIIKTPNYPEINPPCGFFILFYKDPDDNSFFGDVYAKISKLGAEYVGNSDCKKNNKKAFRSLIWSDN